MPRTIDLYVDPKNSLVPDQYTAATNGVGVDLQFSEAAEIVVTTGAFGGTTPTATAKIQDSDDNVTFADAANADLVGQTNGFSVLASSVYKLGYVGAKRYVRVILATVGGTAPVIRAAGVVVKAKLRHAGAQVV